jgi:glucose-6-phosphate 1-dehydrogenase
VDVPRRRVGARRAGDRAAPQHAARDAAAQRGLHALLRREGAGRPVPHPPLPLHFTYAEEFGDSLPEAYETLVRDVLAGDQTLFVHAAEVEASWALYAPLLDGRRAVYPYRAGSWGPDEAAHVSSRAPVVHTAPVAMGGV